ncbi:hypothetical protein F511_45355 [Dorcoceras hygrometricum]|uniref:Uncharacterized protein n=1 Tax=Dorcoceras hygrometricum TaxID=472368 RepID=A0A2Z6ZW79_9LAMI|nr:hypothetical protein F511_45355 [Dorcoceras hygrometricum]
MHEEGDNSSTKSATEYVATLTTRRIGEMRVRNHRSPSHPGILTEAHGWELRSTNTITINTTSQRANSQLETRSQSLNPKATCAHKHTSGARSFAISLQQTLASKSGTKWKRFSRGVQRYLKRPKRRSGSTGIHRRSSR